MGRIFYIIGKSASGKDSIYKYLLEGTQLHLLPMLLYTTRPIRQGEKNGREYFFVTETVFQKLKAARKIIEFRSYHTTQGIWTYFTADDGQLYLDKSNYLGIGTLESFRRLKQYYGESRICPLYIEVAEGERLRRAIIREEKQAVPDYEEVCRRFLADSDDFNEANLKGAGINKRFLNHDREACLTEIEKYIKAML